MAIPGKEIFRSYDALGPIQVFDDGNKRYLAFGSDDEQSCQLKAAPTQLQYEYTRAMLLALLFAPKPGAILLLGLGGGSLAGCLLAHCPKAEITAVELRQGVIDAAISHFQLPRDPRLQLINADAGDFLREQQTQAAMNDGTAVSGDITAMSDLSAPSGDITAMSDLSAMSDLAAQQYDIVYSDIYSAQGVDDLQLQQHYLDQCLARLTANGWLVLNCWREHRGESDFLNILKSRFSDVRMCMTQSGNWIILCGRKPSPLNDKTLRSAAKQLGNSVGFSLQTVASKLRPVPQA